MPWSKRLLLLVRTLHIFISMLALVMLLFYSMTGFMMNHPDWFGVDKTTETKTPVTIPQDVLHAASDPKLALVEYLRAHCGAKGAVDPFEMEADPIDVIFNGPHYKFEAEIAKNGKTTITKTTSSIAGFMANLHMGNDTGPAWHRVIDSVSILLALIALTGLTLWISLARRRKLGLLALAICLMAVLGVFFFLVP